MNGLTMRQRAYIYGAGNVELVAEPTDFAPFWPRSLTHEHMCGMNIAHYLVPYSSFPFPHLLPQ